MKKPIFAGAGVAIVTPFKDDTLKINFPLFETLINEQIENGTDAIVVCGTTGEKSTLVYNEHLEAIKVAVNVTSGRVPVIAGTGSNDTMHSVILSNDADGEPNKIDVALLKSNTELSEKDRVVKKSTKATMFEALDIGFVWLERTLK